MGSNDIDLRKFNRLPAAAFGNSSDKRSSKVMVILIAFSRFAVRSYPFYYDETKLATTCAELDSNGTACGVPVISGNTLNIFDAPTDPFATNENGKHESFSTDLFGVLPGFVPGTDCIALGACVDLGMGFDWQSNYNGTTGGAEDIISFSNTVPDANGTGGVTITALRSATLASVPEPLTLSLFAAGFAGIVASRRRKKAA